MFSLIVFLPLISSICVGLLGYRLGTKGVAITTFLSLLCSAILSVLCLVVIGRTLSPIYMNVASWFSIAGFSANWAVCIDGLVALMFILVTIVSSLVYLYVRLV